MLQYYYNNRGLKVTVLFYVVWAHGTPIYWPIPSILPQIIAVPRLISSLKNNCPPLTEIFKIISFLKLSPSPTPIAFFWNLIQQN